MTKRDLLPALTVFGLLAACAGASFRSEPGLPPDFREALAIVPPDSESLVATLKPFPIPERKAEESMQPFFYYVVGSLFVPSAQAEGLDTGIDGAAYSLLQGREVLWALASKRAQEVRTTADHRTIELGLHPYESVGIARFRDPLPASFLEQLRSKFETQKSANGAQIFRSRSGRFFVLVPKPDLLVTVTTISTSDAMLDDVVARLTGEPRERLFNKAADAWSLSNLDSTVWAIRKTKNGPGRARDAVGRDWVLFSFETRAPQSATFRSVLPQGATEPKGNPWLGVTERQETRKDLGLSARTKATDRYVDTTLECLPEFKDRCLGFPFLIEAFGVMIWI